MQRHALEQIWYHGVWPALPLDSERHLAAREETMATLGNSSYNGDEHENGHSEDEVSDDAEDSEDEDEDEEIDNINVLPRTTKKSAIRAIAQPREERRLPWNGPQPHDPSSLDTADGIFADLIIQLLHFLATEEYEDGRPSSTLVIYFASVLGIS